MVIDRVAALCYNNNFSKQYKEQTMECTYCRKWHFAGLKSCNAPGAPKEIPHKQ